jgi:hypothetical protein
VFIATIGIPYGTESGKLRGVGRILGVVPLLHRTGTKKVHLCPFFFFVSSWDGLYICPLFVFLFMAWASAPVLARLVFGTGVAYTLERCLVWPGPGRTGLFYNILSRLGKHLERCGPGIHVMIRFKEVFGIMGGPRAWFCDAAVDCICVAIVNWVLALSGCDAAASAPRDENIRMFKYFEVLSVTCIMV